MAMKVSEFSQLPDTLQEETEDHPKVIKPEKNEMDQPAMKQSKFFGGAKAAAWADEDSSDSKCNKCDTFIPIPSLMACMVDLNDATTAFVDHTDSALAQTIGDMRHGQGKGDHLLHLLRRRALTAHRSLAEDTFINPDIGAPTSQ